MRHFIHTEPGHGFANEDAVLLERHPADPTLWLCALADGQGGQSGGAEASQLAVQVAIEQAGKYAPTKLHSGRLWPTVLSAADDAVASDHDAGYTTLIALAISHNRVSGGSCGDSGVLLVSPTKHAVLTDRQFKNPPVGSGDARTVAFDEPLEPGDKLLAVSDGVWKFIGWDTVIATCRQHHGEDIIWHLRSLAAKYQNQLPDDFTIALFEA